MSVKHRLERLEEKLAQRRPAQPSAEVLGGRETEKASVPDIDKHIRDLAREIAEIESRMPPEELARDRAKEEAARARAEQKRAERRLQGVSENVIRIREIDDEIARLAAEIAEDEAEIAEAEAKEEGGCLVNGSM